MMQEQHFDVAAYALGVLDERDAARFEEHLIECGACALELETLLPVVDILEDVDADALVAAEQSRKDGVVLQKMIGEVRRERRRANSRRLYSLAAAVAVFAALSVGALFAGGKWLAPDAGTQPPVAQPAPTRLDPLPDPGDGGPGIGGPALGGEKLSAKDPRSGVRADVGLEKKKWGTQVSFAVSNIKGPLTCRLVAVRTDGSNEVLSSWNVGDTGWGTAANPAPLVLQASTATPREDIANLQIQAVKPNNTTDTLVSVP